MRAPFDSIFRWWREESQAAGNGKAHVNGNGHPDGLNGQRQARHGHRNGQSLRPSPRKPALLPPVEPPWLAQLDREGTPRTLHYPHTTLGRIIELAAERFGDNPALIYNQKPSTYRALLAEVNRLAGGLARLGVRGGDRVVLTLPNCPEFVLAFFALQKLGAVVVNAGPLMGVDDLRRVMAMTTPRVVIGLDLLSAKLIDAADSHAPEHFVWITLQSYQTLFRRMGYQIKLWQNRERPSGSTHITLARVLENAPARPPTVEPGPQAVALLQPTSGTTGAVKLVELTHANLLANAAQISAWMGTRDGQESVLAALPMFHIYGLMTALIHPIWCCAAIVLIGRFDANEVVDLLVQYKPTGFPLVPAMCDAISNEVESRIPRPVMPHMRVCMSGGAPLPREMAERFERLTGSRVIEGYGLSETSPVTHANPLAHPRYGTIGLPMPDTLCRVVDLDASMRPVPTGESGELLVSGPQIMKGYFGDPRATQEALWTDDEGRVWLRTGDVACMDADGFFQIKDRKKDMINHSGLKVYPAKVEKVLASHPRVGDVAVIGQRDQIHTEEVVAVIVLKADGPPQEDRGKLTAELRALCRQHLAPYEVPSRIEFRPLIPRSALGKVLKALLREQIANQPDEPTPPDPARPVPKPPDKPAVKPQPIAKEAA